MSHGHKCLKTAVLHYWLAWGEEEACSGIFFFSTQKACPWVYPEHFPL